MCLFTGSLMPFQKLFVLFSFTAAANTSMLLLLCYAFQQVQSGVFSSAKVTNLLSALRKTLLPFLHADVQSYYYSKLKKSSIL